MEDQGHVSTEHIMTGAPLVPHEVQGAAAGAGKPGGR